MCVTKRIVAEENISEEKKREQYIEELAQEAKDRAEKIKRMMSDTSYIEWLNRFTQDKSGFSDDDWLYCPEKLDEADRENVGNLSLFYEGIAEHAKRVHCRPIRRELGNYYKVRLNKSGFRIGVLFGQGARCFCERVPVENEKHFIDFEDIIGNVSKQDSAPKSKAKTKTFYAVAVYSELGQPEIKAYCRTKKIAARELKKYTDEWHDTPPKPDDKHILKFRMIVE